MTPTIARAEVAAAREAGWYETTWHNAGKGAATGEMAPETLRALRIVADHPQGIGAFALSKVLGEPNNITGNRVHSLVRRAYIAVRPGEMAPNRKVINMLHITDKGRARLAQEGKE